MITPQNKQFERIIQDPRVIDRPAPYNINDYIEYQINQQMLKKNLKKKLWIRIKNDFWCILYKHGWTKS